MKIYINLVDKNIDYCISTINNDRYFNKLYNNKNIVLFLYINYNQIQVIDSNTNNILYDSAITTGQNYIVQIKNKSNEFIDIKDKLNFNTIPSEIDHIQTLYDVSNNTIKNVINKNYLEYKIIDNLNNQNLNLSGFFNIIDLNAYHNQTNTIDYENLIFNIYNGFTNNNNKLNNNI